MVTKQFLKTHSSKFGLTIKILKTDFRPPTAPYISFIRYYSWVIIPKFLFWSQWIFADVNKNQVFYVIGVGAETPQHTCKPIRKAFSTVLLVSWAEHRVGLSRSLLSRFPSWLGRCCVRRPAGGLTGWAEARAGRYRSTREKRRERDRQRVRQRCAHNWCRAEKRRGQRRVAEIFDGTIW